MEKHQFATLADFKGLSLDYFTTHADLVRRQKERRASQAAEKAVAQQREMVQADTEWTGDDFVAQSNALAN